MKTTFRITITVIMLLCTWYACSDNDSGPGKPYDPNQPVRIETFMPDSGGIRTKFIIKGENFGSNPKDVKVYFNHKPALVLSSASDAVYALVPKQPGDSSTISIVIGNDSCVYAGKKFIYHIASSVSTVVGKAKEAGNKDGTIDEALFGAPAHIAIDNEDNLFVNEEESRTRLVSLKSNKVLTLLTGVLLQNFGMTKDRNILYAPDDGGLNIYELNAKFQWIPGKFGRLIGTGTFYHCATLGPEDKFLYTRRNDGDIVRMNISKPTTDVEVIASTGIRGQGNIVYNPKDNYLYVLAQNNCGIFRVSLDGQTVELYTGGSPGYQDGPVSQALFNKARGIAVDSQGYLYVADESNHCIRKIDVTEGLVSTIAGTPKKAGYKDGSPEESLFNTPRGVVCDKEDFIYIADKGNHCIRKLSIE